VPVPEGNELGAEFPAVRIAGVAEAKPGLLVLERQDEGNEPRAECRRRGNERYGPGNAAAHDEHPQDDAVERGRKEKETRENRHSLIVRPPPPFRNLSGSLSCTRRGTRILEVSKREVESVSPYPFDGGRRS
jgi:hypothetical protein